MREKNKLHKTTIGGQAVIEGVMMKGPLTSAMAVRTPENDIHIETWETSKTKVQLHKKIPFIRGIFNFFDMLVGGYKCLMKSAEIAGFEEEQPSKFEQWLANKLGDKFPKVIAYLSLVLSMLLAMGLFMLLPSFLVSLLKGVITNSILLSLIEGIVKIGIFILYLYLVSKVPDVKRVFEYHGAEHKTISCYESEEELTVENVRRHTRFHPRCGTSFLLIVLVISVVLFSLISWDNVFIRVGLKLLLMPLVVGISYEIIKLTGRYDNMLTRLIAKPGMALQNFTTKEPDDTQLEVAIAAIKPTIPQDKTLDKW